MPKESVTAQEKRGLFLIHTLEGFGGPYTRLAWSPHRKLLACASGEDRVEVWDAETGTLISRQIGRSNWAVSLAWSPSSDVLAIGSGTGTVRLSDAKTGKRLRTFTDLSGMAWGLAWSPDGRQVAGFSTNGCVWDAVTGKLQRQLEGYFPRPCDVAWSPDGRSIACGSHHNGIAVWNVQTGRRDLHLEGHSGHVGTVAWSPDGHLLASGSSDNTIRIWDIVQPRQLAVIEGHTGEVRCVSFSPNGAILASKSWDGTIRLWRCDAWETLALIHEPVGNAKFTSLAFHAIAPLLASPGHSDWVVRIWEVDYKALLSSVSIAPPVYYTNAKVVLVGDTGVGKSGLSLVLTGQPYQPTSATHGRRVWSFESKRVKQVGKPDEIRETLLWDLAGQPGYRLIHQLHLTEAALALVVFDSRSETDPFSGVRYWARALQQAKNIQGDAGPPTRRMLVAARIDVGGIAVSKSRLNRVLEELGFDDYFETSAKENWHIEQLAAAIRDSIEWQLLPKVSSNALFHQIKAFLLSEKLGGRILSTADDLYRSFLLSGQAPTDAEDLPHQFPVCIALLEARGLIRRLSFGSIVLLQPELLDSYASSIINAAKEEPDGLGSLAEEDVRNGRFLMPHTERVEDTEMERLLLIATIEDLLHHEIALREPADEGPYLVFPSNLTKEYPDLPELKGRQVVFEFEGPIMNVYATLVVRLSHCGVFRMERMWKNAAVFTTLGGGKYGMVLRELAEGQGELTLFFDSKTEWVMRVQFNEFVHSHLRRRSLPERLLRRWILSCPRCGEAITDEQIKHRREREHNDIVCPVCETKFALIGPETRPEMDRPARTPEMNRAADTQRDREIAATIVQGKAATKDFDVFLAYNTKDAAAVRAIAGELKQRGLYPWLDMEQVPPGRWFQDIIQESIPRVSSAAVFIGPEGLGRWQAMELRSFISQCVEAEMPVIPVLLPGVNKIPKELVFLKQLSWVRFSKGTNDSQALDNLEWGITGRHPKAATHQP